MRQSAVAQAKNGALREMGGPASECEIPWIDLMFGGGDPSTAPAALPPLPPPAHRRYELQPFVASPWHTPARPCAAFELLSRLPQHGLGSKLSRTSWTDDCYWTVQKVRVSPVRPQHAALCALSLGLEAGASVRCSKAMAGGFGCMLFCTWQGAAAKKMPPSCPPYLHHVCQPACPPSRCDTLPPPPPSLQDGKHGTAWGVLTWRGQAQQADKPTSINGPLKPVWRVVHDSQQQWQPSGLAAALKRDRHAAKAAAAAQPAAEAAGAAEQPAA